MCVKCYVITIDEDVDPNSLFIDRATAGPIRAHVMTGLAPNLDPRTQTTVLYDKDTEPKELPEYVADEDVDYLAQKETYYYKVRWNG